MENLNGAATGGPNLVVIGDKSYLASPLDDRGHSALLDWVKKRLKSPLLALEEDNDWKKLSPHMQERAIRAAVEVKTSGGTAPNGESYRQELLKPKGCAFLAWLMIRKEHPGTELKELETAITDDNCVQVLADLNDAAGLGGKARTGASGSTAGNG